MKKIVSLVLGLTMLFCTLALSSCDLNLGSIVGQLGSIVGQSNTQKEEEFYNLVSDTQELLDEYADDIYSCWYDYIYEDEYSSVDSAILSAMIRNSDNIEIIEANNEQIKELYKNAKDGKLESEVKDVMHAYNDYYAFVMEVSGSFNSFSASKETLKKELSSALKNLEFELD